MMFLLGALCYAICTMKALSQALEGPGEEPSWHLRKPPVQSLPNPSRAWRGGFKVFLLGALCYTICTMKASQGAMQLPCNTWEWPGTYKLYCSRPLPALAGRGLMRTLCCAVCAMKGSGLGRCSLQLAGGCLIHKLYPLTFSVATRPLSAFAWRVLVVKHCAMPFFL